MAWFMNGTAFHTGEGGGGGDITHTCEMESYSLSASSTKVRTIASYTNSGSSSVHVIFAGYGYTDTGSNEGRYELVQNNEVIDSQVLSTGSNTNFNFQDVEVAAGETVVIQTNWVGDHFNCSWTIYLVTSVVLGA